MSLFIEVAHFNQRKHGENASGDAFYSRKILSEDRLIAVLSDGLGSGIKANILANMTATMALRFVEANRDILSTSRIIMDALPVCQVRKISYATFTIVDTALHGRTRIVEQGNPGFLLIRDGRILKTNARVMSTPGWQDRELRLSEFVSEPEDRLVVFSDGVSQAGLGSPQWRLGWREQGCSEYILRQIKADPLISARKLCRLVVHEALNKEPDHKALDDISCAVFYFRRPRRTLVLTGPAYDSGRDHEAAAYLDGFAGRKVVCGGTTANIVARELDREVVTELPRHGSDLPPVSRIAGLDLVTEGILTLTRAAQYLETTLGAGEDPASRLAALLIDSDQIEFLVGTRINDAHQDPKLPVDLEIRRNIVKRIAKILEQRYLKETAIQYI